jgi:Putative peptidoglycan binding domain
VTDRTATTPPLAAVGAPPAPAPAREPRRPSRRALLTVAAGAVVAAVVAALVITDPFGGGSPSAGIVDNSFPTALASIERRSLSSQTQVSATLGYSGSSTIDTPAGTSPSALQQAEQTASTAQSGLAAAQSTLATDSETLTQAQATLAADRQKQTVDCRGAGAAESASSGGATGGSSSPCATDGQAVSTDQQAVTGDSAKVTADRQAVASAERSLSSAATALADAETSATSYGQSSTYTGLPAAGAIVHRGGTLYEVDNEPVVLLYGAVAPWRAFAPGMSPGRDVAELNANLRALGYGSGLTGDAYDTATEGAVQAFQQARGMNATGQLLLGSVVFEPGAVRITTITPTLGATVQPGPVLTVTSTTRQVTIELDAAQQSEIKQGDPVVITLPDNSTTPGVVSKVGTVATASPNDQGGSSTPTIEVDVTPTHPAATGNLDQAPVNVSITTASVKNVLVVPVASLLSLANGGYAVEEAEAGGAHKLVAVSLGLFDDADGYVQVSGDGLAPGQKVVIPSE